MFTFLNSFLLPALAAASIPIILHFLSRKKARKLPFSSIKFLKSIENQRIKRVKLYQFLLILVRTLFIIFIVLAFARPTMDSLLGSSAANAQTTAVIIFDDSYSMQSFASSQTFFEVAKNKLQNVLNVFNPNDRVWLSSVNFPKPEQITPDNKEALLKRISPTNQVIDFHKHLLRADSVFRANVNLNNELYVISDFKITAHVPNDTIHFAGIRNFKAYKLPVKQVTAFHNRSIDSVRVRNQLIELNKPVQLEVFITNHDDENVSETNLNLFNENERVAMDYVSLNPAESGSVKIDFIPKTTGIHHLKVQVDEDDLFIDNSVYFSIFLKEEINTLFVSDYMSQPMSIALQILSENTVLNVQTNKYSEWLGSDLNQFDLIVFDDLKNIDQTLNNRVKNFIASGRSVIIIPGETLSLDQYNAFFTELTNRPVFSETIAAGTNSFFSIENNKNANPVFSALFREENTSFSAPRLYKYIKQSGFEIPLITLANRDVLLSRNGSLYVFSTSFSSGWTDFEINGLFVPMLYRTFYMAAQNKSDQYREAYIGDNIIFDIKNLTIDNRFSISNPENELISVIPEPRSNRLYFNGGKANIAGFYTLLRNDQNIATVAVNHNPNELKKPFITDSDFSFDFYEIEESNLTETIQTARIGFELWIVFVILAFIMLLVEMTLIKTIEGTSFRLKI